MWMGMSGVFDGRGFGGRRIAAGLLRSAMSARGGGERFGFGGGSGGTPWRDPRTGSPFRGFPGHGPGPRRTAQGDVRAAILALLVEGPMHGYQIIQEIGERTGGVWRPSPGSVYPALQQLEDEGLISIEKTEGRKVAGLTDAGRAHVEERHDELEGVWEAAMGGVDKKMFELRDLSGQVFGATMHVASQGTDRQIAEARRLLADVRRRLYGILAEDEPSDRGPGTSSDGS